MTHLLHSLRIMGKISLFLGYKTTIPFLIDNFLHFLGGNSST